MKKHFSLIELLVVIAIIAVLAAMLLPALQKARESAKNLSCMNQCKTISIATASYVGDYNGFLMPYTFKNPNNIGISWGALLAFTQNLAGNTFVCPSFADSKEPPSKCSQAKIKQYLSWTAQTAFDYTHYGQNYQFEHGTNGVGLKIDKVRRPSEKIVHAENYYSKGSLYGFYYLYFTYDTSGYVGLLDASRHGGKVNTEFTDGHVESIMTGITMSRPVYNTDTNPYKIFPLSNKQKTWYPAAP